MKAFTLNTRGRDGCACGATQELIARPGQGRVRMLAAILSRGDTYMRDRGAGIPGGHRDGALAIHIAAPAQTGDPA